MAFISTKIAIGIGVGIVSLLALCYFVYWGVRKFRHRTRSTGQISATPEEIPVSGFSFFLCSLTRRSQVFRDLLNQPCCSLSTPTFEVT